MPDAILCKPDALTSDEFDVIRGHPAQKAAMLAAFEGPVERAVIRHHHEWFDGTGDPDGLAGEAIPLEARIAAVRDVYDALRSDRSYRAAWSRDDAEALIHQESGTHFDPRYVRAFAALVDRFERDLA